VEAHYTGGRLRTHAIEVGLGDAATRVAWFYGKQKTWMKSPAFRLARAADTLTVKAIQAGGGGVNAAPEMQEMVIMLDRIRVVRIEEGQP